MDLKQRIRSIEDFPKEGIIFRDITTLLKDPHAFRFVVDSLTERYHGRGIDIVVGMESRGFIFGAPLAHQLSAGFVPVRKPGKLPSETVSVEYQLEYGNNTLQIHRDAIGAGQKVLIVDDLLATGGTAGATVKLVERLGGVVAGLAFVVELSFLNGRDGLARYDIFSLVTY